MSTHPIIEAQSEDWFLADLDRIEGEVVKPNLPVRAAPKSGFMGRMLGRSAEPSSQDMRIDLEMNPDLTARVAVVLAYRLLNAQRREIVQLLPEALFDGALPKDDEDRFMVLADAAQAVLRQHMVQDIPMRSEDESRPLRLCSIVDALDDDSVRTMAERLRHHLHARLMERGQDVELAKSDALLVEVDNVMFGDVDADGRMAYATDVVVDGHALATVASIGDGTIEVLEWLGDHGPDDLEALRSYVAEWGEPRSDGYGERPDSLEELLLDRVTALLMRYAYIQALSDAVLFCDTEETAPGGQVIRVMPIHPDVGREATWDIVVDEFPNAVLLDAMNEQDGFVLWMAYSTV